MGWRLQLFSAAFRLGVELRTQLYERLSLQGPPFFQPAHRRPDGLATNDVDAVEMAAGEAFLAGFDGTLTLVLVVAHDVAGRRLAAGLVALLPFPLMALASGGSRATCTRPSRRSLDRFAELNDHVQETLAGVRTVRALGLQARSEAATSRELAGARRGREPRCAALGSGLRARRRLDADRGHRADAGVGGWLVWHGELTIGAADRFRCTWAS